MQITIYLLFLFAIFNSTAFSFFSSSKLSKSARSLHEVREQNQKETISTNSNENSKYNEMLQFVFNDAFPQKSRESYLSIYLDKALANKELEIKDKELALGKVLNNKELEIKDKEFALDKVLTNKELEIKDKDVALLKKDLLMKDLATEISKLNDDNSKLTPRAIIEYVEIFVMDKYEINKKQTREQKWIKFLESTDIGKQICLCIEKDNPLWGKGSKEIATRIKSMYQVSSDYHHCTSLEINDTKSIPLKAKELMQSFNLMRCIAVCCDLKVTTSSQ